GEGDGRGSPGMIDAAYVRSRCRECNPVEGASPWRGLLGPPGCLRDAAGSPGAAVPGPARAAPAARRRPSGRVVGVVAGFRSGRRNEGDTVPDGPLIVQSDKTLLL